MVKLFDRRNKIATEGSLTNKLLRSLVIPHKKAKIAQLAKRSAPELLPERGCRVRELTVLLNKAGVKNLQFDVAYARTRLLHWQMFGAFDLHRKTSAMFGGGRYDGLVGLFGAEPVPTVGMAPGFIDN